MRVIFAVRNPSDEHCGRGCFVNTYTRQVAANSSRMDSFSQHRYSQDMLSALNNSMIPVRHVISAISPQCNFNFKLSEGTTTKIKRSFGAVLCYRHQCYPWSNETATICKIPEDSHGFRLCAGLSFPRRQLRCSLNENLSIYPCPSEYRRMKVQLLKASRCHFCCHA